MRCLCLLVLLAAAAHPADWKIFRIGPFEVIATSEKDGREMLNDLEQLRHTIAGMLGKQDLQTLWPVRVIASGNVPPQPLRLTRNALMASAPSLTPRLAADVSAALIDANTGLFPANLRRGMVHLLSTIEIKGTRITLGAPPAGKDRDWSRAHMLAVHPDFSGKLRVLLGNLEKGVDAEIAYRNAFEKTPAEVEKLAGEYAASAQYATISVSARPLDARRQLLPQELPSTAAAVHLADAVYSEQAYEALLQKDPNLLEAHEGLGLLGRRPHLEKAASLNSANARVHFALGDFAKAAQLNKRWPEPLLMQASREPEPARRVPLLKLAAQLDPSAVSAWTDLAAAQEQVNLFADAAKSWAAAERAAGEPAERERIRQSRAASEQRRIDKAYADKEAARRKAEQEIADLRNKALSEIRAFEARANAGQKPLDAKTEIVEWDEVNQPAPKLSGVLTRVDCAGEQARIHVAAGKKVTQLLVKNPEKVIITGGRRTLGCGAQRRPAAVTVEHRNGEVLSIEFR